MTRRMGLLKRFALMALACCAISVAFAACQNATPTSSGGSGGSSNIAITPLDANGSPTPTFPPFTVGAWPSNFSPDSSGTLTIYALCRVQDATMNKPSGPPTPSVQVSFSIGDPVNKGGTKPTDAEGLAVFQFDYQNLPAGKPITISVSATYNGVTANGSTFFTPNPVAKPTNTPGPNSTPGSGAPGATPSPSQDKGNH